MKRLLILLIMIFAIVLSAGTVSARSDKHYDIVINGEDNPAVDVQNIQDAVDGYDKILLRGTFDLGTDGTVKIIKDIEIVGDSAIIKNGVTPFVSPLPSGAVLYDEPLTDSGPDIIIEGIEFNGSGLTPIMINYSRGIRIIGNTIKNVMPYCVGLYSLQLGLEIGTHNCYVSDGNYWANKNYYDKMSLTGVVEIHDNNINLAPYIAPCGIRASNGVIIYITTGADISVSRNLVENGNISSLLLYDNFPNELGEGQMVVEKNIIKSGETGHPLLGGPFVVILGHSLVTAPQPNMIRTTISHNEIDLRATTPGSAPAIVVLSPLAKGTTITSNHLIINRGPENFPNYGMNLFSGENYIGGNKIEGEGFSAFLVLGTGYNVLQGNNISNFNETTADIILNSDENTVIGGSGTIIDNGVGNVIKGNYTAP